MLSQPADASAAVPSSSVEQAVKVDSASVVRKLPQPTSEKGGLRYTSALPEAQTTSVPDFNPTARGIPITCGGGGLGSFNMQRLAVSPRRSIGAVDSSFLSKLSVQPTDIRSRLTIKDAGGSTPDGAQQTNWMLYGAYGAAGLAVLGLGYVVFSGKKKGKPSAAMPNPGLKFYLRRIRLDRGGYDSNGRYWGIGAPLFQYEEEGWEPQGHLRASSRADAKAQLRKKFPGAKFFR